MEGEKRAWGTTIMDSIKLTKKENTVVAKFDVTEINSLNDLSNLFFKIAKSVEMPLRKMSLTLEMKRD